MSDLIINSFEARTGGIVTANSQLALTLLSGWDGWLISNETWTYASADAPTFTFTVSGDLTTKYYPGQRIKLTQTTVKYFIITAVAYASPNTTITVYGGTDYTLTNAEIQYGYYSMMKAPAGFPLNPAKWTVEVTDTVDRSQASPTQNAWYNLGSVAISIPIGIWDTEYEVYGYTDKAVAAAVNLHVTLSTIQGPGTGTTGESDIQFTMSTYSSVTTSIGDTLYRRKILSLSSKTTYYLNTKTAQSGMANIFNVNSISPLFIRAVCTYL